MSTEHTDVRQVILDTALPIILGKGFSAVGLNQILTAANVPKGSFYHYFKSKDAFGAALLEDYFSSYLLRLDAVLQSGSGTALERLLSYLRAWRDSQSDDAPGGKCLVVKLSAEVCDLSEAMRAALDQGTAQVVARIAECLRAADAEGSLRAGQDPQQTALSLYSLWLGASLLGKIRHDDSAFSSVIDSSRLLLGVKTRA
jgi:TetR/AcrR family transcriptional repressor of nem operon